MLERDFQRNVIKFLKQRNAVVFNLIGNAFQRDLPDLYVAHLYWSGWIELKVGKNKPTPSQISVLERLRQRKVNAFVLTYKASDGYLVSDLKKALWFPTLEACWKHIVNEQNIE